MSGVIKVPPARATKENTLWSWPGARWWKFDFHAHTPASSDYGKGPDAENLKKRPPREWLLDYMRAEVDCVAITDHNTGAWIDELKNELSRMDSEKPDDYRSLVLFPGVELTVNGGFHLLALFDQKTKGSDIDRFLGAVGLDLKSSKSGITRKVAVEVIDQIIECGGLAIPAHVDGHEGLFKDFDKGDSLAQIIKSKHLIAMEVCDSNSEKPKLYIDNKCTWTEILGSDAHHPDGSSGKNYPGSRFTWVKMGQPSLEGLRLALLDGELSIRRSDHPQGDNPNVHGESCIESLIVSKARYMGRGPTDFECSFNPWMNAMIGGRGTGKSTLIEFLRLALRRWGEWPASLQKDFEKYARVSSSRQDDGLLTEDTRLTVIYRKAYGRFRIQWIQKGEKISLEVCDETGTWQPTEGNIANLCPVRIFSQKQIFEFAKAPNKLLEIIDHALGDEYRNWETKWEETEKYYLALCAKEREVFGKLKNEENIKSELLDIQRRLVTFEQTQHASILQLYQHRKQQQRALDAWVTTWSETGLRLRELETQITPASMELSLFDPDDASDREVMDEVVRVAGRLNKMARIVARLARQADACLQIWQSDNSISKWKQALHDAETRYETLRNKLREEKAGEPNEFGQLLQKKHVLEQQLKDMESQRITLQDLQNQKDNKLKFLAILRTSLTRMRTQFLEKYLYDNQYVSIRVVQCGDKDMLEEHFRKMIDCESGKFDKDIGTRDRDTGVFNEGTLLDMIKNNQPEESISRLKRVMRQLYTTGTSNEYTARDSRFVGRLKMLLPEKLDRLEIWFPNDALDVRYSSSGNGKNFQSIQAGSPGQKTAALLAFLLSYGEEPLILDQPEDDLDNQLIYDLIVSQFRSSKPDRQVIVVTHNANIVVNGDAEQVISLGVVGGQTQINCAGNLQEQKVREEICRIMEGGREAFERRYRRIAHGGQHV
ncbi:MAG: hypothetical protein H7833_19210 [Magnetococcus sp. DMHC-1]